jgi:signal transduction histidine kinase
MKHKLNGLSQKYVTALQKHLQEGPRTTLQSALGLGRMAVALGLETLELARMHEGALATLLLSNGKGGEMKRERAETFFTEALSPIEETHPAARQSKLDLDRLNETLNQRTLELAATNRELQQGILERKSVEGALRKSGEHYAKLLKESLQFQESLRQLTRDALASQEDVRKKISRELQDEIAQILLGINVRLMTLRQEARANTAGLKNDIASAQRFMAKSGQSVRKAGRKLRNA